MTELTLSPELSQTVGTLEQWGKALVIQTVEGRNDAIAAIKTVKERRCAIVAFFADTKQKAHAAWKAIVSQESSFTDKLDAVESSVKRAVLVFDRAQEQQRSEEQGRLQKTANEAAQRERDRLAKEAERLKTPALKQERLAMAQAVVAPVVTLAPVAPRVEGVQTRKTWKARVVDAALVPREFLTVNQAALDAFAKAVKGATPVAGVEFYEDATLAIR